MQLEIDAGGPPLPIQILGINKIGHESGNADITAGRVLPWLQATAEVDAWASWGVTWRDVVLVDPAGHKVGVYNLTEHDLGNPENAKELKTKLLALVAGH